MPFIALGVAMIIVDATIVNVAIPVIIRDLRICGTISSGAAPPHDRIACGGLTGESVPSAEICGGRDRRKPANTGETADADPAC